MSDQPLMRCHEARPYLSAYADDELDEALRERVAAHLASCAACSQEIVRYQAIDKLVGTLPGSTPSPDVLDRVLAATSSANKEQATRESLRQPQRPLAPRTLPAFILADATQAAPLPPVRQRTQRRRSWLIASALPTLAALLIITFTFVAFHNRPGEQTVLRPTPTANVQTTIQQTDGWVSQHAGPLGFTPILPTYLPPGAQLDSGRTKIGQYKDDKVPYLDVTWTLAAPFTDLHLRETTEPFSPVRTDYVQEPPNTLLTWQIMQDNGQSLPQWFPVYEESSAGHLAIGQNFNGLYITLDIGARGNLDPENPSLQASAYLRLTSLSVDMPYQALPNPVGAPSQYTPLYFQAQTTAQNGGQNYLWEVYSNPGGSRARASLLSSDGQQTFYVDYLAGPDVWRFSSTAGGAYQKSPASGVHDPFMLSPAVSTHLSSPYQYIQSGEFWYLGTTSMPAAFANLGLGNQKVEVLTYVSAPYPTMIYVNSSTGQIIGVITDTSSQVHPGTVYAASIFADNCLNYTTIVYLPKQAVLSNLTPPPATVQQDIPTRDGSCS